MNINRGFTLIELLVVIAIIGVLSSIVLSSLNTARSKSNNSAIKSNLANARVQAELYSETDGTNGYQGVCTTNNSAGGIKSIRAMVDAAHAASPATSIGYTVATVQNGTTVSVCHAATTAWAVSVPLKVAEAGKLYWCVDSTGTSAGRTNPIAAATVCPAS